MVINLKQTFREALCQSRKLLNLKHCGSKLMVRSFKRLNEIEKRKLIEGLGFSGFGGANGSVIQDSCIGNSSAREFWFTRFTNRVLLTIFLTKIEYFCSF